MILERKQLIRLGAAALLGSAGLWVVMSQALLASGSAGAAAAIGIFRGDLWASQTRTAIAGGQASDVIVASAGRWAASSPLSGQPWLVMAEHLPASEEVRKREAIALAFSAAPGAVTQMSRRLAVAAGSAAITDASIEQYVRRDIAYLLNRDPRGEQILRDVDRGASPLGRYRLRAILVEISPGFAASLPAY